MIFFFYTIFPSLLSHILYTSPSLFLNHESYRSTKTTWILALIPCALYRLTRFWNHDSFAAFLRRKSWRERICCCSSYVYLQSCAISLRYTVGKIIRSLWTTPNYSHRINWNKHFLYLIWFCVNTFLAFFLSFTWRNLNCSNTSHITSVCCRH